eukprot:534394-Hanusia_phi.AAC.1
MIYFDTVYDMHQRMLNTWSGFRAERLDIDLSVSPLLSISPSPPCFFPSTPSRTPHTPRLPTLRCSPSSPP